MTRLDKKRGWKGTYDELIGGGEDGMDFIRKLIHEILNSKDVKITLVSLMLSSENLLKKTLKLLPKCIRTEIVQINARTRRRFILMFFPLKQV